MKEQKYSVVIGAQRRGRENWMAVDRGDKQVYKRVVVSREVMTIWIKDAGD